MPDSYQTLERRFAAAIRSKGEEYYRNGQVEVEYGDEDSVQAQVNGSQAYFVELKINESQLDVYCDCLDFMEQGQLCKHVWSAVLASQDQGHLSNLKHHPGIELNHDSAAPQTEQSRWPWKESLQLVERTSHNSTHSLDMIYGRARLIYLISLEDSQHSGHVVVRVARRQKQVDQEHPRLHFYSFNAYNKLSLDEDDVAIRSLLAGQLYTSDTWADHYRSKHSQYRIEPSLQHILLPIICRTKRCYLTQNYSDVELQRIYWNKHKQWQLKLRVTSNESKQQWVLDGGLHHEEHRLSLSKPHFVSTGGVVFWDNQASQADFKLTYHWVNLLRMQGSICVPFSEQNQFLKHFYNLPMQPHIDLPKELTCTPVDKSMQPRLQVDIPEGSNYLSANLDFAYGDQYVGTTDMRHAILDSARREVIARNFDRERHAIRTLQKMSCKPNRNFSTWEVPATKFETIVEELSTQGWRIENEGQRYRAPDNFDLQVQEHNHWLELGGKINFGDQQLGVDDVLEKLNKSQQGIQLADGSIGILPAQWLERLQWLKLFAHKQDDLLRFSPAQSLLLQNIIPADTHTHWDEASRSMCHQLALFEGIKMQKPGKHFNGTLREYQQHALGWFDFLRQFNLGGCLADDMGLGKTVQVLALLQSRKRIKKPSLIVMPKSLIFNWQAEAERFTPDLKLLDFSRNNRTDNVDDLLTYDVIITTYGVLRRSIELLQAIEFDYVVLDESQAIKNATTHTAQCAYLLQADYRLALSGTPIENHLGELWSLMHFLNPGILGAKPQWSNPLTSSLDLHRSIKPFFLRRTKQQVLKELPPKVEQTLFCELEPEQRRLYNDTLKNYQTKLHGSSKEFQSNMHILTALLRLRQIACHPSLVEIAMQTEPSGKLEMLMQQLRQIGEEGYKTLVFSQFTSMLSLIRRRLDERGVAYEYLDGKTQDREKHVKNFQEDPDCKVFLISLKAGGTGLNLTSAEYVFIFDPWWNPAVERQAIDRSHRIGQEKTVMAYRLIAKDTIEEKIMALQQSKRQLVEDIMGGDSDAMESLTREDLEFLLS